MAFKDWKDRAVRMKYEISTAGGKVYPAGTVCWTGGTGWRGRVDLYAAEYKDGKWVEHLKEDGCVQCYVRGISPKELEVVDGTQPPPSPRQYCATQFRLNFNKQEGQFLLSLVNGNSNRMVECVNNSDFEGHFNIGVFYLVRDLVVPKGATFADTFNSTTFIGIEDKFGDIVQVPPKRFKCNDCYASLLARRIQKAIS